MNKKLGIVIGIVITTVVTAFIWGLNRQDVQSSSKKETPVEATGSSSMIEGVEYQSLEGVEVVSELHTSFDYRATTPNDLYDIVDTVLVGKYVKSNRNMVAGSLIFTESTLKVTKVIKGSITDAQMKNGINIRYVGGEMMLGDYLNGLDEERRNDPKKGTFTQEERKTKKVVQTIKYPANADKDRNCDYLIFLTQNPNDINVVACDGYGMRKIDKDGNVFNLDTGAYEAVDFYSKK